MSPMKLQDMNKISFNKIGFGNYNPVHQAPKFEYAANRPFSLDTLDDKFEQSEGYQKAKRTYDGKLKLFGKIDNDILAKLDPDFLADVSELNDDDTNLAAQNIKTLQRTNCGNPFEDDNLLNHANCANLLAVALKKPEDFNQFIQNIAGLNSIVIKHFGERTGLAQTLYHEAFCALGGKNAEEFETLKDTMEGLSQIRFSPSGCKETGLLDDLSNKTLYGLIADTNTAQNVLNNAIRLNSIALKPRPGALMPQSLLGRLSEEHPFSILKLPKKTVNLIAQNARVLSGVDLVSKEGERQNILEELSSKELLGILSKDPEDIEVIRKVFSTYPKVDFRDIDFSSLDMMMDFAPCVGKGSICELTKAQRSQMARCAIKHRSSLISGAMKTLIGILPYDKETYNEFLTEIKLSQGIEVNYLTEAQIEAFEKSLFDLAQELKTVDFNNLKIDMKISTKDFVSQIAQKTRYFTQTEKVRVCEYFGFNIDEENKLTGYPVVVENKPLPQNMGYDIESAFLDVKKAVLEFSTDNPVTIGGYPVLEKTLNNVLKYLGEFRSTIGKEQHSGHIYTLDVHMLKVLSEVIKNPEFEKLSDSDKKIMLTAALLHDITKKEGKNDEGHPRQSAADAYFISKKLGFSAHEQIKLYDLIKNHDWLEQVCLGDGKTLSGKAFELKCGNLFELARIFTGADLKGIDDKGFYVKQFAPALDEKTQKMRAQIEIFKKTQPLLPVSKFPKASELKEGAGVLTLDEGGVQNKVIDLNAVSDFESIGFGRGTSVQNLKILLHAIHTYSEQNLGSLDYLSALDSGALISTSYLTDPTRDFKTYMDFGVILDVDTNNIHAGKNEDFASGTNKDIKDRLLGREDFALGQNRERNYFPDLFKKALNLSDNQYIRFVEKYQNMTPAQIEAQNPDIASKLCAALDDANEDKKKKHKSYNEILITRGQIQAVFIRKDRLNYIPLFLRKYAQEQDIPVVLLGT